LTFCNDDQGAGSNGRTLTFYSAQLIFDGSPSNPALSCAAGLLANPDFESGATNWNFWSNTSLSSDAYFGSQAAYADANGNGGPGQNYNAGEGEVFALSVYAKKSATATGSIGIKFYDASWNELKATYVDVTSTTYENYVLSLEAPANTAYAQALGWKNTTAGEMWWDGFCFEKWTTTAPTCSNASCELSPSYDDYIFSIGVGAYENFMDYDNADLTLCDNGDGTLGIKGNIINGQDAALSLIHISEPTRPY